MRLIDADALIERLDERKRKEPGIRNIADILNVQAFIDSQPIAYDVDKVVEQFEEIRVKKTCNKEKCDTKEICRICVVDDAIEIVKQGGVGKESD